MTTPLEDTRAFKSIQLGHETDTEITRVSAGVIAVDGQTIGGTVFDVRSYGTIDGTADDVQIQAAMDAATPGGVVVFPEGTYTCSTGLVIPTDITLKGIGNVTIDGADSTLLNTIPDGADNVTIKNIRFYRFARGLSQAGASLLMTNIRVEDCRFDTCGYGVLLSCPVERCWIINNTFKDITASGATSAILVGKDVDEATQGEYVITGNTIDTVTNTGVGNDDTHGILVRGRSALISHNYIQDVTSGGGVGCEGIYCVTHFSTITNNTLINAGDEEASITLKGGRDDGIIDQGNFGYDNIISNNMLYSDTSGASAIYVTNDNCLISNNIIEGFPADFAISVTSDARDVYIIDNYFTRLTSTGAIVCDNPNPYVKGNIIELPESSEATFYGILLRSNTAAISTAEVSDNYMRIDDQLTSTQAYTIFFDGDTNPIDNVRATGNRLLNISFAGNMYGYGWSGAAAVACDDVILGGNFRGTITTLVRFVGDGTPPTSLQYDFDNEDNRTFGGKDLPVILTNIGTIELGHVSDTTLARAAAGRVTVEGVEVATGTPTVGNILYADGTTWQSLAAGATTEVLVGGGAAAPVWTTATGTGAPVRATSPTISTSLIMADAADVVLDTTTGSKIGTATNQKLGFFNATPVVQQTGYAVPTDLATCISALTTLRTALNNLGLTTVV